jgi:hypothetical protein
MKRLKDIAKIKAGRIKRDNSENIDKLQVRLIVPLNIQEINQLNLNKEKLVGKDNKATSVNEGDIIMVLSGPNAGKYVQYQLKEESYISEHLVRISSTNQPEIQKILKENEDKIFSLIDKETIIPRIYRKDLENLKID